MTSLSPAEQLLHDLGITEPDEIDVEVIAWAAGARVRYLPLARGDARIVGRHNRAIITVDAGASRVRQRFSVAHELGHWHHHRGQRLMCHGLSDDTAVNTCEREADGYAADLLMPRFMLVSSLAEASMSLALIERVAELFDVSLMAAVLRLSVVHPGRFAFIAEEPDGRRWFRRSSGLPKGWHVRLDVPYVRSSDEPDAILGRVRHVPACRYLLGRNLRAVSLRREVCNLPSGQTLTLINAPL